MRYLALACDYDGTLAHHGRIDEPTFDALEACRQSGRRLLMVTGRELDDLKSVCDCLDLFDWIVAENGALLYCPRTREEKPLADPPSLQFVESLKKRGVGPLSVGRVIVATWEPHQEAVLDAIREHGLELQVIFNKGAVMVLPSGVNKAFGLREALCELGLSVHNTVAIGDAENDHALLSACEASVAVANAVPKLKERADLVTEGDHGAGVQELIRQLLEDDLACLAPRLARHHLLLGNRQDDGSEVSLSPYGTNFMICGSSGAGKSTLAAAFLERLIEKKYQFCVIDPEGDYVEFEGVVPLGTPQHPPTPEMVVRLLESGEENAVVNMIDIPLKDRPEEFLKLLTRLHELRATTGRPHWILVDEAHHVLPAQWEARARTIPDLGQIAFITIEPDAVLSTVLERIDTLVVAGQSPETSFRAFADALGESPPALPATPLERGEMAIWFRHTPEPPFILDIAPGQVQRRRHKRKYAQGEIEPVHHFFFRGPDDRLNLRAQNLIIFLQLAEGVDDATWEHHRRQGDYSQWFREGIKDPDLADEAAKIEADEGLVPSESKAKIKALVEERYTLPTSGLTERRTAAEAPR